VILVLSHLGDNHAASVLPHLARVGAEVRLLDLARFPTRQRLVSSQKTGSEPTLVIRDEDEGEIRLTACNVVWWRRPRSPRLHSEVEEPSHRQFAAAECAEALAGLWPILKARWVNSPQCDLLASRKLWQLAIARQVGLEIPETTVTNDPEVAREQIDRLHPAPTVYKAFTATPDTWRETRLLKEDELALLDNVKYAPVIFQEYIPAAYDLRITMVGDKIFPAAIHSQETSYQVDYRMDLDTARIEPVELPELLRTRLAALMRRMGLHYGAVDMRRTPEGRYVFLEINPAGQWLFVEERTGQRIGEAVARLLCELAGSA